jgi:hypothetical protein
VAYENSNFILAKKLSHCDILKPYLWLLIKIQNLFKWLVDVGFMKDYCQVIMDEALFTKCQLFHLWLVGKV